VAASRAPDMTTGDRTLVTFDVHSTFKVISDRQSGR
jgi:hypothetical protein